MSLSDAVSHVKGKRRFFSHELPSEYIAHAIGQGAVQSGFNTSLALGLPEPKRDKGRAAAAFVFTRQIPSHKNVPTKLNEGQVGASTDAMLVFKPSMFADPKQPAFFKTIDGAHHSPSIMPSHARKGTHIKEMSDSIAGSSDKTLQANQEQGVHGTVALHHLAAIVLKTKPGRENETKAAFIEKLHNTPRSDLLPPIEDRRKIKAAVEATGASGSGKPPSQAALMTKRYEAFEARVLGQSAHDRLGELINADTTPGARRRRVEDLVVPLNETTERRHIPGRLPRPVDGMLAHERIPGLGKPNPAFFKPRS
jgi:hypothetical protein